MIGVNKFSITYWGIQMVDSFSLKRHKNTGELHLFKGRMNPPGSEFKCGNVTQLSECKEMNKDDSAENKFTCETEDKARKLIADIGRAVCGTCTSTLYTTYQKKK